MDYLSVLNEKLGAEEAEAKIKEKTEGFHGLLTKEAAAKLIASEMGLIERDFTKVSELVEGMGSVDIKTKIVDIGPLRSFPSGAVLRVLVVSDGSGEASVNFWGDDGKKAGRMHLGDTLEVKKGYVKMGKLNIGYKSTYSVVEKAEAVPVSEIKEGGRFMCTGKVDSIKGRIGNSFVFSVEGVPVSVVNYPSKGNHLQVGDSVLLEGVEFNGGEIVVEGRARMLLKKNRENIFRGKLEGIEWDGNRAVLVADGEKFFAEKHTLIKFLKLKEIKEDIDLHMIVKMKVPGISGKDVLILFKKGKEGKEIEQAELR
ncbi:hypothetical protein GF412_02320 [Candidatus Micrarchaeota archaeon]|nr:hypothetical protein [Candidatus Micrarchaeota archaeon]MBD3417795.1 hypothetical protein [Candidatus Micrarchaeota archaeon]